MESELSTDTLPENISPALAEKLKLLAPGTYCLHRSWGFGRIKKWETESESVVIDFKSKQGHVMQFEYAAESLTPLPGDHVQVQKAESLDAIRQKARENTVALVEDCLRSLGPQATADGIEALLSPDVVSAADYKKWWEGAKRALKKNGHFYVPGKKNEALRRLDAPSALGDSAMENLRLANGPKAVLLALGNVSKYWSEIKGEATLNEVAGLIDATLSKVPKSQLPVQIELALARDEFYLDSAAPPRREPGRWSRSCPRHPRLSARCSTTSPAPASPSSSRRCGSACRKRGPANFLAFSPAPTAGGRGDHDRLPGGGPPRRSPGGGEPLPPRAEHHLRLPLLALQEPARDLRLAD